MSRETVESLRERIATLERELASRLLPTSPSISAADSSDDDNQDNPYSRLVALEKMNVVPEYAKIRQKTIAIIGVGGIGSVASEMLTRCGVGKLLLFDYDVVSVVNMNRLFFLPIQIGLPKVAAASSTLHKINPDVDILTYDFDVTSVDHFNRFQSILDSNETDLLLCCVDNFEARIAVNRACLSLSLPWIESGVSETATSGHIQFILPGLSACYECAPPLIIAKSESPVPREGVCTASLPTTMAIIAGLLVQNSLKYLLSFGEIKPGSFVGYNALTDFFPTFRMGANFECSNRRCREIQNERREQEGEEEEGDEDEEVEREEAIHGVNEWGIEVVEEREEDRDDVVGGRSMEEEEEDVKDMDELFATFEMLQDQ